MAGAGAGIPKLFYFDGPGRAEVARLIFVYAGKEFEDVRFASYAEWTDKYKSQSPLGTAPFYQEGDVKIAGSIGIARYVADANGLGGSSPIESAQLESYVDALFDYGSKLYLMSIEKEEGKKEELKKEFLEIIPAKLELLEKQVKGEDTFLAGKLTYPDIQLSIFDKNCDSLNKVFKDCPKLQKIIARVDGNEKIKAYRAKHPLTS